MRLETYPSEVLRTPSVDVTEFDDDLKAFVTEMESLLKKVNGLGLAAPQMGINKKVVLCALSNGPEDEEKKLTVLVNPEIIQFGGQVINSIEGCLSAPSIKARLKCRHNMVSVSAFDLDGMPFQCTYTNADAVIVQHELDHLDGITIIDRMHGISKQMAKKKLKKFMEKHVRR